MPVFKMSRSYEGSRILDTQDLLAAVKSTCNYEGDLYVDGHLIMSCLGLSRKENTRRLLEYGITSYVNQRSNCWNYRYTDPSKSTVSYFLTDHRYMWENTHKVDFTIDEYRKSMNAIELKTLGECMDYIRVNIDVLIDAGFTYNFDEDIYVKMYGEDGLIYFAPGDWQADGEPEMYSLVKEDHKPEYGAKHYMQKRYEQLQPKFGGYTLVPAASQIRGMFEAGDVVILETPVDGLEQGMLYLIDEVEKNGDQPEFTIRDLDDYEVSAKVQSSMISMPNGMVLSA